VVILDREADRRGQRLGELACGLGLRALTAGKANREPDDEARRRVLRDELLQLNHNVSLARDHRERAGDGAKLVADGDADADLADIQPQQAVTHHHDPSPASGVGSGEASGTGWRSTLTVIRSA